LPKYIVGIEDQVNAVSEKLYNARTLAIVGMGGLGKTTLSKALFNKLAAQFERFEYSCFVYETKNIQGRSAEALRAEVWRLMYHQGKKVTQEENWSSLKHKRLLLVLDDIASERDLTALSSILESTSPDSRFVVTTRDQQLVRGLDVIFDLSVLQEGASRELFVSHAFGGKAEPEEMKYFVDSIVQKCGGLPLSLEVVGKSLLNEEQQEVWKETERALIKASDVWEYHTPKM
jgi:hypothetical protein